MCDWASKQSSDLKNYTDTGPRPLVFKFLDPPLVISNSAKLHVATLLQKTNRCFYLYIGLWIA